MKNWNVVRIVGLIGAVALITFGSVGNLVRTLKFGFERISQR